MIKSYKLEGLCCANCAQKIEDGINRLDGVNSATIAFMPSKLKLAVVDGRLDEVLDGVRAIIKKIEPDCELIA